jgi:SWI/SNF-related matrix-associated actin-dependent regulator 1 of chromatin subfamily A
MFEEAKRNRTGINVTHLTAIEDAKQAALMGKLPAAIQWVKDFISTGEKLVLFVWHKAAAEAFAKALDGDAVVVTGDTSSKARQAAIDAFQTSERVRVFIGNIQAAGVGITLTAASNVAFVELPWRPGDLKQAGDRVDRIGQTAEYCTFHYLLAAGTIDETILDMNMKKQRVVDHVMDGDPERSGEFVKLESMVAHILGLKE